MTIRIPWINYSTGRTYFFFKWIEDGKEDEGSEDQAETKAEDSED